MPLRKFAFRMLRHGGVVVLFMGVSLAGGVLGYRTFERMPWIDALLNASMILGGMGPVGELHTASGKLFASFYALYSGIIALVAAGVLFAPIFHRMLHKYHLDDEDEREGAAT